jgi:tight adherence protein B
MALLIQRQVGGNLAEILNIVAHTIDDRIRIKREINVLTAQGRLSGWVLVGLPFAFVGLMAWISPAYIKPLFTTSAGHILLGGGIFMDFLGLLVIKRLVHIEM